VRALLMMGGFFGQYLTVKRVNVRLNEKIKSLDADGLDEFCGSLPVKGASLVEDYLRRVIASRGNEARIELLVSEYEIEADKQLSTSKVMTKMGPILGLMGTLIPMGPALVGLSTGDIASMAYNMQVAFATTVVGMVISAIGFVTQQFKERWLVRDMAVLEYVARLVTENR
jgi:biopolymer transport protein ExbB/TolQ